MITQYVIVGLLIFLAAVYTVVKFVHVWKGKDSNCGSCPGCDLQDLKSNSEKTDCAGPEDTGSGTDS